MDAVDEAVEVGVAEEGEAVEDVEAFVVGGNFGFDYVSEVLAHGGEAGWVSRGGDGGYC